MTEINKVEIENTNNKEENTMENTEVKEPEVKAEAKKAPAKKAPAKAAKKAPAKKAAPKAVSTALTIKWTPKEEGAKSGTMTGVHKASGTTYYIFQNASGTYTVGVTEPGQTKRQPLPTSDVTYLSKGKVVAAAPGSFTAAYHAARNHLLKNVSRLMAAAKKEAS